MNQSLLRTFSKYVTLNILGMISLSCYILADTFFVAQKLGAVGLAALNLSIPIYSVIHGLGLMLGIGGATRFTILQSQDNDRKANIVFSTALRTGVAGGLVLVLIGLLGSSHVSKMLGADASTLPLTKTYLTTILVFAPFFIMNNVVLAFVRNDDNPNLAMFAMVTGSLSNIVLDYVFMFPLGMGMFGAALATCLAPMISLIVLVFHFAQKKGRLVVRESKLAWNLIPDMFSLGLSTLITEVSSAAVLITFNLVILGLEGNSGVAAYGIVANLGLVGVAVFTGLAQGAQPLMSRSYGMKSLDLARKVRRYALITSSIIAAAVYFGLFVYAESIVAIFNREQHLEIARMAQEGLRIYFSGFFFLGVNIVVATYLSATEQTKDAFFLTMARGIVVIIPLVLILSRLWGMRGIWLAFVLTESIVTAITVAVKRTRRKRLAFSLEV